MSDVNGLDRGAASAASVRRTAHVRSRVAGAYRKITPAALPAAAALLVAGLCLRLFHLSTQSLWTDEGYSLDYSACAGLEACVRAITSAAASEKFDILYFLMLHVWRDVFGSSTIALRSLSVILSVLTLPVIWLAAERLFGRRHAVWSLALAATSAFSIFYAQETRPYAFLIFLTAVQVWLFSHLYAGHAGGARKIVFLVVTFVASWASIYCVLFSMALAAAHLVLLRQVRRTIVWWLPLGAACVPAVIYYCVQTLSTPPELITLQKSDVLALNLGFILYSHLVGQTYSAPLVLIRGADRFAVLAGYWWQLAILAAVGTALLGQLVARACGRAASPGRHHTERLLAYTCIAFLSFCLIVAALTDQNWLPRHAFALHVLLMLLLPTLLVDSGRRRLRLGEATLAALIALNLSSLGNYYFEPAHWRDDYRGMSAYLSDQYQQGYPAVLLVGKISLFRHYGDNNTIDGSQFQRPSMASEVMNATGGTDQVLIVINREFAYESENGYVTGWTPRGLVASMMSPYYHLIDTMTFHYFTVYRFSLADGSTPFGLRGSVARKLSTIMNATVNNEQTRCNRPVAAVPFADARHHSACLGGTGGARSGSDGG